jgi:N-acyl-D-aspartate/D-glutamate deacylase
VTTILFGNCRIGFTLARPEHREGLVDLMEAIAELCRQTYPAEPHPRL